ncbi:MAG: S26 family signal peptidase, partial [Gemmataceae bacterium]
MTSPSSTVPGKPPYTPPPAAKPWSDVIREGVETIVFVVVLVFLLKQFVVEAFVIPTGSMAESLYGYQKMVTCAECGYEFPLNSSCEVDPQNGVMRRHVMGYCCPNCRYKQVFSKENLPPFNGSGDRVLVHKTSQHIEDVQAGDVVVFKYPVKPQIEYNAQNYIKRAWGRGGETVAIWRGDLYVCKGIEYPADEKDEAQLPLFPRPERPQDAWETRYVYHNADRAQKKFEQSRIAGFPPGVGGFELIRKPDDLAMTMRRIVNDNNFQSKYLAQKNVPVRWKAETTDWTPESNGKGFAHQGASLGWLRYRHTPVQDWPALAAPKPPAVTATVIDNFLGYNAEIGPDGSFANNHGNEDHRFWVGDLMLECTAEIIDPAAEIVLELSKGENRFQAKLSSGQLTLTRTGPGGKVLGQWPTGITKAGTYALRFANIDCRL